MSLQALYRLPPLVEDLVAPQICLRLMQGISVNYNGVFVLTGNSTVGSLESISVKPSPYRSKTRPTARMILR